MFPLTLHSDQVCFYIQMMFRYLCEDEVDVLSEKQFLSAVRNLATKLILSGKTESVRNDLWPLESSQTVKLSSS